MNRTCYNEYLISVFIDDALYVLSCRFDIFLQSECNLCCHLIIFIVSLEMSSGKLQDFKAVLSVSFC